jgi:hypothetical protein
MTRLPFLPVISGGQVLTRVELFERIRADRRADPSSSARMLARRHGVSRRTVKTALGSAMPPPRKPPVRSRPLVLTPVLAVVDEMLRSDLSAPRKQRHTIERTRATPPAVNCLPASQFQVSIHFIHRWSLVTRLEYPHPANSAAGRRHPDDFVEPAARSRAR